jgi:hypothetical protein
LTLATWAATVLGSPVLPSKISMATGTPSLETRSHVRQLEALGYTVTLTQAA